MSDSNSRTVIQELMYRLKVGGASKSNLITLESDTPMNMLRIVLRENRISGVPIVEHGKLTGVISLEDFIKWMYDGRPYCPVKDRMSKKLVTLYSDEPLISAIEQFRKTRFGRFPVIDRKNGVLTGILTKRDIIEYLLHELEIDYREEEIKCYRVSHLFEDLVGDKASIHISSDVEASNFEKAGRVSSDIKKTLKRLGVHPEITRRAAIASYEAEMNLVIYSTGGEIKLEVNPLQILITIKDGGPGIEDLEKALEPGYSTASQEIRERGFGAGMGLVNIKKCSDTMNVVSTPGRGTTIKLGFNWVS